MNRIFSKYFFLIVILLSLLVVNSSLSQTQDSVLTYSPSVKNPEGKEFWLCFMKNFKDDDKKQSKANDLLLELFITGDKDANVIIEVKSINLRKSIFVPAGTVKSIKLDPQAQVRSFEIIEPAHSVHITSDNPISVYGLNRRFQTTDTYLGLPLEVLGTEYRVMSYSITDDLMSEFAVVATENNTIVEIAPTVETVSGKKTNESYKVTLNQGDVYQVGGARRPNSRLKSDLTGSYIKANKKIAVFSGHQCAYVPSVTPEIIACNHLAEQLPPLHAWGKHFYIGRLKLRSKYTYRVLAHYPNTKLFENSNLLQILNPGEFYEKSTDKDIQITADKPVLVAQYSQGFKNGDSIGDPMMLLISPTQQFLRKYRFATPVNGEWEHIINIVVQTNSIRTMQLDGKAIDTSEFRPLGISRYSIAYLTIPFGTHVIEGAMPFGMYSYGFGKGFDAFDAYGTMGGQSFMEYEPVKDINAPTADINPNKTKYSIILRDDGINDTGIKDMLVLDNVNIDFKEPSFIEAIPQYELTLTPQISSAEGRLTFQVRDMALNESLFTICYVYDQFENTYRFVLNTGSGTICSADYGYTFGAFFKYSQNYNNTNFIETGNLNGLGKFTGSNNSSGYFGILASKLISDKLSYTAKLTLENYNSYLSAPDSTIAKVRDITTGELKDFHQRTNVTLNGIYSQLFLGAEYLIFKNLYLSGGLSAAINFSESIDFEREIIFPYDFVYANGKRKNTPQGSPKELSSISTLRFGAYAGIGYSLPIYKRYSAFVEADYNFALTDLTSDASWKMNQLSILLGMKFRL